VAVVAVVIGKQLGLRTTSTKQQTRHTTT